MCQMQTTDKKDLPLRARYYQSLMDIESTQHATSEYTSRRTLEDGLQIDLVARYAGLPLDEVRALQEA